MTQHSGKTARGAVPGADSRMRGFDFGAPAELFAGRARKGGVSWRYKRFNTAAEAVRFAIEDMPESARLGAYLEVDEARFGDAEIRKLYEDAAYPFKRATTQA